MERAWLEQQLAAGRSIESLARELARDPSTVAYWVNKHGLTSRHAPKHAARGGLAREELAALVERGMPIRTNAEERRAGGGGAMPIRTMAEELGVSYTTVRHWLKRYRLSTARATRLASTREARATGVDDGILACPVHGPTR